MEWCGLADCGVGTTSQGAETGAGGCQGGIAEQQLVFGTTARERVGVGRGLLANEPVSSPSLFLFKALPIDLVAGITHQSQHTLRA